MQVGTLRRAVLAMIVILSAMFVVSACGSANDQASGSPAEVQITLSDFRIESPQTTFSTGRPYRFVIKNEGTLPLAWAILPRGETDTGRALFQVDESQLQPGATVTEELAFAQAGDFELVCYVPGHYEAGMFLPITIQKEWRGAQSLPMVMAEE
jgi:uncharacterized cupredoxin-like copper-binding protein